MLVVALKKLFVFFILSGETILVNSMKYNRKGFFPLYFLIHILFSFLSLYL